MYSGQLKQIFVAPRVIQDQVLDSDAGVGDAMQSQHLNKRCERPDYIKGSQSLLFIIIIHAFSIN